MTGEKRIKILVVLNVLGFGGAEVQIARAASYFDRKKFDIQVAYYDNVGCAHPAKLLEDSGIRVIYLDRPKWGRIPYLFKAAAFMRRERFDIVHAWHGSANFYATVPAMAARVPAIIGGLRGKHGRAIWILKLIINLGCECWTTNAKSIKDSVSQKMKFLGNKPAVVIPNGLEINNENIFKRHTKTFFDDLRTDRPVIGTVGRFDCIKNHLLFVDMARRLIESGCRADFWIVGDGPMRSEIKSAVEKHGLEDAVKILGYRTDVDVALSRMDVFVLTSDSEGCPNALLEAMRASLPVVSTNCTSLEEIIEEGVNGYTAAVGDSAGLVEKVKLILADADSTRKMGAESRRIVEERFSLPIMVKRFEDTYVDCLKRVSTNNRIVRSKLQALGFI